MIVLTILFYAILLALLLLAGLVVYARWHYGELEKLGMPVKKPTFMFGSVPDFYKRYPMLDDIELFKKYGSVFGLYEGRSPKIFVADPELVKLILVRDYDHFSSRGHVNFGHPISNEILDYLPDDRWKAVRSMLTPNLSSGRVKQTVTTAARISDEFVSDLIAECGLGDKLSLNLCSRMIAVLVDITATSMFGMELENRRDHNNTFVRLMTQILCEQVQYDFRYTLMLQFPFLSSIFSSLNPFAIEGLNKFQLILTKYVKERRKQGDSVKRNDLGQVFVDMMNRAGTHEFKQLGITEATAMAQVLESFFGAYDSTGTAMTFCVYHIAKNAEVQNRVLEEVDRVWEKYDRGGKLQLTHEVVGEFTYLTACINESLRMFPPFIRPERKCTQDWSAFSKDSGKHIRIKKGQEVYVPIWALHRHPDYFDDPETFNPDRFMPGNKEKIHPYAWIPFGGGPKNCIGMKLAYSNMVVVLSRLFKDFRIHLRPDTKLNYKKGTRFVIQYAPLNLDVVRRS